MDESESKLRVRLRERATVPRCHEKRVAKSHCPPCTHLASPTPGREGGHVRRLGRGRRAGEARPQAEAGRGPRRRGRRRCVSGGGAVL